MIGTAAKSSHRASASAVAARVAGARSTIEEQRAHIPDIGLRHLDQQHDRQQGGLAFADAEPPDHLLGGGACPCAASESAAVSRTIRIAVVEGLGERRFRLFVLEIGQAPRRSGSASARRRGAGAHGAVQLRSGSGHALGEPLLLVAAHELEDVDREVGQHIVREARQRVGGPFGARLQQFDIMLAFPAAGVGAQVGPAVDRRPGRSGSSSRSRRPTRTRARTG